LKGINMAEASQLWPEGPYDGTPESIVYDVSSVKKAEMVKVTFDIGGNKKRVDLYLSDAAWPYSEEKLKRLEFNGDFINPDFNRSLVITLNCRHETGNDGKVREKWDFFGSERPPVELDKSRAMQLKARFKANAPAASKPPTGKPTPPAPKVSTPPTKAPPSKGPPPQGKPSPSNAMVAQDRDEAWEYWGKKHPDMDDELKGKMWLEAVNAQGDEDKLTPEQWNKIALVIDIPF
jgi:hypothetical protein